MTAQALSRQYGYLHPEERFKLILAAANRNDDAERERLTQSGATKTLNMTDHWPYALAFLELSDQMFLEVLSLSADYLEGLISHDKVRKQLGIEKWGDRCPVLDLTLAYGYEVQVKLDGWERFCSGQGLSAFQLWKTHPGYERVERARSLSKKAAFVEEGYARWLKARSEAPVITAEAVAQELEEMYRQRITWWQGPSGLSFPVTHRS